MKQNGNITDQVNQKFTGSDEAESYRILHQCPHYRIGFVTRAVGENLYSSSVEVAVTLLHDRPQISVALLEKDVQIVRSLKARGYTLNCHDDACVSAELGVAPDKLQAECLEVRKLIEEIMARSI